MPTFRHLASLSTIAIGLATLEWWSVNKLYESSRFAGPITGVAFVTALALLLHLLSKFTGHWYHAFVAALTALVELTFCVVISSSLSAIAAVLLPDSITGRFMQGDSATDFIIFLMLAIGLVIAARGWSKYSSQALLASKAQLETERARSQLAERDRELARSELTVLRAQIEPHFLWNTLAHVQHLTRKRPEDAERMIGHLIRFLRAAVPQSRSTVSTLGTELESVEAYLELMKIRMGARLTAKVEMDRSLADVPFPPLLIQTLVENAIKHGIEPKVGVASLTVTAKVTADGKRIVVEVTDDGVGLQATPATQGTGMGLKNVRERLQLLYGTGAALFILGAQTGGVTSRMEIPFPRSES
jgi:sensor histidine kinase YesM